MLIVQIKTQFSREAAGDLPPGPLNYFLPLMGMRGAAVIGCS